MVSESFEDTMRVRVSVGGPAWLTVQHLVAQMVKQTREPGGLAPHRSWGHGDAVSHNA